MPPTEPKVVLFPHDWEDLDSIELDAIMRYYKVVSARDALGRWVACNCPKLVLYYIDNQVDVRPT